MKVAFVFPGQGSQTVGMGRDLYESSAAARRVFEEADAALGEPLHRLIFEGPADDLTLTANAQPAILTVSIAALEALRESRDLVPDMVAGHSLGEFSALVCAGALDLETAVRATRARGTFMQEAVPPGSGAMAAILRIDVEDVARACEEAAQGQVVAPANFNSPGQVVVSGHREAVDRAVQALEEAGARAIPLTVSAPFHCALMEPAARHLDEMLGGVRISDPSVPVITNVEALPNLDGGRVRELLVRQVTSPVRWADSVRYMLEEGVDTFVELGPGNVLAGLVRKIDRNARVISAGSPDGVKKALEALEVS